MLAAMDRLVARALEKETRAVLAKADLAVAGWSCPATSECCQLKATGVLPWLHFSEWRLLLGELADQQRPLPPPREDGGCPFLDATGKRCSVYAARPVACRTYFCHRAQGPGQSPRAQIDALFERLHAAHLAGDVEEVPRSLPEWYERERGATPAGTDHRRGP
jgi:uncharacterized protein